MDSEETDKLAACTTTTPRDADLLPVLLEISASLKRLEARLALNLSVEPLRSEEAKKGTSVDVKNKNEKKPLQNEEEDEASYDKASLFSRSENKETLVQYGEEIEAINDNASIDSKIDKEEGRPSEEGDKTVNNRASLTSSSPSEEEGKALNEERGYTEGSEKQGREVN
jgi:hypothetical protein